MGGVGGGGVRGVEELGEVANQSVSVGDMGAGK